MEKKSFKLSCLFGRVCYKISGTLVMNRKKELLKSLAIDFF